MNSDKTKKDNATTKDDETKKGDNETIFPTL